MKIVLDCILKPEYLNKGYKEHILNILKEEYIFTSKEQGYIIDIYNIEDIIHNYIDHNFDVRVKTLCDVDIIKLVKDIILEDCEIIMIHNNGIFVKKYTIKILIPNTDNVFDYNNNTCHYKDKLFECGDKISVQIQDIRFEKNEYTCIGTFKD
tara:strand:- start:392 stop:850 length:459 start_codon:yes stop_codon:yes gene_type:complete